VPYAIKIKWKILKINLIKKKHLFYLDLFDFYSVCLLEFLNTRDFLWNLDNMPLSARRPACEVCLVPKIVYLGNLFQTCQMPLLMGLSLKMSQLYLFIHNKAVHSIFICNFLRIVLVYAVALWWQVRVLAIDRSITWPKIWIWIYLTTHIAVCSIVSKIHCGEILTVIYC